MPEDSGRKPFKAVVVDARGRNEVENLARARFILRRWRRTGLEVSVVCTRAAAHALPDHDLFEVVVGDDADASLAVDATVRLLGEATLRVDAGPSDTLLLCHTVAGVTAARALGFRRIVGVDRNDDGPQLLEAGATSVVRDLSGLRFPRVLPAALQCLDQIDRWRAGRSLAIFLDFDGTLAPIVPHPDDARLAPGMRAAVARLAQRYPVAVISGRDQPDVAARVGIDNLYYAGSHGLDIAGHGRRYTPPGAEEGALRLESAADAIAREAQPIAGVYMEYKRFSVAVHYRQVADPADARKVAALVERQAAEAGLKVRPGKQVREVVPDLDWHKGRALDWLRETLAIDGAGTCVVYVGDDETDEDAFQALGPDGIGLRPGPRVAASLADYHLPDVDAVQRFLEWLAE